MLEKDHFVLIPAVLIIIAAYVAFFSSEDNYRTTIMLPTGAAVTSGNASGGIATSVN